MVFDLVCTGRYLLAQVAKLFAKRDCARVCVNDVNGDVIASCSGGRALPSVPHGTVSQTRGAMQ